MKKIIYPLTCLLVLLSSCNTSSIYNSDTTFTDNQWFKKSSTTFEFTIEDESKLYDLSCILSHVYDYQFDSIPLEFKISKPDGTIETIAMDYLIKDESGKELGDCAGDICDLQQKLLSKVKLTKGTYSITITHTFEYDYLPNIIRVGIDVSTTK
jgi:gliding motility-associated lipoprotein GldH